VITRIVNFPKQHSANCTKKHQAPLCSAKSLYLFCTDIPAFERF